MRAIGAVAIHRIRASWRGWAALVLLLGLAGGAVLAAAAGFRRTDTAYPRFLRGTAAANVLVSPAGPGVGGFDLAVSSLPGVREIAPIVGLNVLPLTAAGKPDEAAELLAPLDGRFGHRLERPKLLAGRQPAPNRPDEIMVDQIAASQLRLHVGSTVRLAALSNVPRTAVRYLTMHVVGVEVTADSIVPVNPLAQTPYLQASAALYRELGLDYWSADGDYVKLSSGTTVAAFTAEANRLAREPRFQATGGQLFVADETVQDADVEQSIRPQALALAIFALVLAVTALLVLGQTASRLLLAGAADNRALAALGLTRRQLLAASLLEAAIPVTAGAVLACAVAVAASPLMPIGPARLAELHPGLSADVLVLLAGCAATVVLLLASVARTAWRATSGRLRESPRRPGPVSYGSRAAALLASSGAPVTAVTGVRMALEPPRTRGALAVHGALIGTVLSVAAVMASVTFGVNLTRLEGTPRLYGQTWDAAVDLQFGVIKPQQFGRIIATVRGVTGWTYGLHGTISVGRNGGVPAIGLARGHGQLLTPTMLAGHPPAAHQVVLGALTMRSDGIRLGQSVSVAASGQSEDATVVGAAVFPYFGQGSFTATDLGRGALVPASMLAAQAYQADGAGYNFILVSFTPGAGGQAALASFRHAMAPFCATVQQSTCVITEQRPNGVTNYDQRIAATPLILAGLLALLGLGVLAQFTFQSARSRRREFAVLRTLGLQRRQVSAISLWQITTITGLALLVGLPLGAAAGHWAWTLFAGVLGISPGTTIPLAAGLAIVPAALLAANALAMWPVRGGARIRAAELLRTE